MPCFEHIFKHDKNLHFGSIVFISVIDVFTFLKLQVILGNLAEDIKKIAQALLVLIPSWAGLNETQNRLSIEKANKLAFCLE